MKQDGIISPNAAAMKSAEIGLEEHDWDRIGSDLNGSGCPVIDKLLTRDECRGRLSCVRSIKCAIYLNSLHRLLHDEASTAHCATQDPDSPQFNAQE